MIPLTDKQARDLARQIVTESDALVRIGKTNGENVLHVRIPGGISRTIKCAADWDEHPANFKHSRDKRDRNGDAEKLVTENKGLST